MQFQQLQQDTEYQCTNCVMERDQLLQRLQSIHSSFTIISEAVENMVKKYVSDGKFKGQAIFISEGDDPETQSVEQLAQRTLHMTQQLGTLIEARLARLTHRERNQRSSLGDLRQQFTNTTAERDSAVNQIRELTSEVDAYQVSLAANSRELAELRENMQLMLDRNGVLQQQVENDAHLIKELQSKLKRAEQEAAAAKRLVSREHRKGREDSPTRLKSKLSQVHREMEQLRNEVQRLRSHSPTTFSSQRASPIKLRPEMKTDSLEATLARLTQRLQHEVDLQV
jgi:chromosome segregation ATPase